MFQQYINSSPVSHIYFPTLFGVQKLSLNKQKNAVEGDWIKELYCGSPIVGVQKSEAYVCYYITHTLHTHSMPVADQNKLNWPQEFYSCHFLWNAPTESRHKQTKVQSRKKE